MFWKLPHYTASSPVFITPSGIMDAGEVSASLKTLKAKFDAFPRKTLGIIIGSNAVAPVLFYLAGLQSEHAVMLLSGDLHPDLWENLLFTYQPDWILHPDATGIAGFDVAEEVHGWTWHVRNVLPAGFSIHPSLALLLPTSGTTGSPQMVRLSYTNLASNAESIVTYLALTAKDRAITSLPMHYSYGLSVINSHLLAGASLVLTNASLLQPEFWQKMQQNVTFLAGVPSQYQMLRRLRFEQKDLPSLRILTQAGGRLPPGDAEYFAGIAVQRNWQFFVMYGQTEATARIAYVPPHQLAAHNSAIGIPIPGGTLSSDTETHELIYQGPNVMMGYARTAEDLALGDVNQGILHTGDIGEQDTDGFWKITGRMKRFLKLAGLRINLDELELHLANALPSHTSLCTGKDDALIIWVRANWVRANEEAALAQQVTDLVFRRFGLHPTLMKVKFMAEVPLLQNGKIDYRQLEKASAP